MMKLLLLSLLASVLPAAGVQQLDSVSVASDTSKVVLTLEDALKIAMSENISVKVADMEIQRTQYAKKGSYASLFPQIDGSAAFQRTIQKQVMYMDSGSFDVSSMVQPLLEPLYQMHPELPNPFAQSSTTDDTSSSSGDGFSVGRWNTWSAGITASMPLVNAQLWKSLKISGQEVELAVEKARSSRLDMISQVKNAFYAILLAKEAYAVYEMVYENAVENLGVTQMRYNAQKATEMELVRAKTTVASVVPDLYTGSNNVELSLWQLKALMGVDLDMNIDVAGSLQDYADQMVLPRSGDDPAIDGNSSLRQLSLQLEELATTVKMNKMAYVPSLAVAFNYTYSAMTNDFNFSEYKWTPYSYVGLSLSIPIFSGGKRLNTVRASKVQMEQLRLQRENAERQLRIAVRSDLNTMVTNVNSYEAARSAVQSAQKGYDISAKSYQVGRSTLVELNDALLALSQAQLMQWQAVYSYLTTKSDLEKQIGADYSIQQ